MNDAPLDRPYSAAAQPTVFAAGPDRFFVIHVVMLMMYLVVIIVGNNVATLLAQLLEALLGLLVLAGKLCVPSRCE